MMSFNSRKLLLLNPTPTQQPIPANLNGGETPFDADVVMVLSILLCALICSFCLNFLVRCALRCSSIIAATPSSPDLPISTGIEKKALEMFPTVVYTSPEQLAIVGLDAECVICLSEFVAGDKLRLLPKCSHGFHVKCIDTWLISHSTCPKCRHNLLETCQKIVGSPENFPATIPPLPQLVVDIQPLDHEGPVGCT